MTTLFENKKVIPYSFLAALLMELYNASGSLPAFFGLWIFFFFFFQFFQSFGKRLPIRILFMFFMSLQLFFTSYLAYFVYPEYQYYKMAVSPDRYFTYTIAAVISFAIGLYWKEKRNQSIEVIDLEAIRVMAFKNPTIAYIFIGLGIVASFAGSFISGAGVAFVLYVLSQLKFVGLFLIILGSIRLKQWLVIAIYAGIIISSFKSAMFHDLVIWTMFLFSILALKYKPSFSKKLSIFIVGAVAIMALQVIKQTYRQNLQENEASVEVVLNSAEEVQDNTGGLLTVGNIAPQISRFNQGWIVASVLDNVPNNVPFANGETIKIYLEAAFLPRAFDPDKLMAGDKEIFTKYSGKRITEGTSMALSSVSDAYINYGETGGCLFLFIYGFLISLMINYMSKKTKAYPFLPLFALIIFAYAVRIECELQTVLGHIVKSSFILWVLFTIYNKALRRYFVPVHQSSLQTSQV